jgi:tetratricopeptide (TPR) repeat protein
MKKTFLNKLLLGFSTILLFVYGVIFACGGGDDWGWSFDSNFAPETFVDKSYAPLFLSQEVFYTGFDTEHNSRFNDEIVQDWSEYLKAKMDAKDVKYFLIDSSAADITKLQHFYKTQKKNVISNKWSKKIDLNDRKISSFITFLSLCKQVEIASVDGGYNWSYEPVVQKTFDDVKTIKTIESRFNTVQDTFLKNRYWFQTIKAYFYNGDYKSAVAFFQKTENTMPKNTLYYRALAYIAGMNYKNKNYALSNHQYSQVFDKCPAMRVVSAYCFHPKEEKDWNASLNLAKPMKKKSHFGQFRDITATKKRLLKKSMICNLKANIWIIY